MTPPLPAVHRSLRAPVRAGVLTACALLAAGPLPAMDLSAARPRERSGHVFMDVHVADPFESRVRESLGRGMPVNLHLRAELWRRRNGWFDRLESSTLASVRIRYEVWSEQYRIDRPGADPVRVATLDSVVTLLSRPWSLRVGRVGRLHPQARYYVVIEAVLKPLSVEDIQEVEGWLSGEVRSKGQAGLGVVTELPRALFDAVRNFAGFGDRRSRAVSEEFGLRDLFPPAP